MSWKVRLGIGIALLFLAIMVLGIVKNLVFSLVPLAILLLIGYGLTKLYFAGKREPATPELPKNPAPVLPRTPPKDAATRLREIRAEAARQSGQP